MAENAHPAVLNREEAESNAAKALAEQIALMEQMANYGTNLLVRVLRTNSKLDIGDVVACSVFLRQVVAMLDSLAIAFRAGSGQLALLAARPGFEAGFYLEWMLLSDTKKKGEYYYVADMRRNVLWARRSIAGTQEHQDLQGNADLKSLVDSLAPRLAGPAQAQIVEFDRICGKEPYKSINDEFDRSKKRGKWDKDWFALLGPQTIREIARTLGRLPEYDLFYGMASRLVHSTGMKMHLHVKVKDEFIIKPLRGLEDANAIIAFCVGAAFRSFELVLKKYRPGELGTLGRIYVEEWRKAFLTIPKINVTYTKS